jgi:glycine/D-amino acid oxidase-like deaminating enzyme
VAQGKYLKPPTPGLIVTSKPFKQTINKILVGPGVHVYQRRDGVVILGEQGKPPTNHDQRLSQRPEKFPNQPVSIEHGQRIVNLAVNFIPQFKDLIIEKVEIGWRPLPLDGKPVIGFLNKYEYLATMHSGISLAPIVAELVRDELMFDVKSELLNDFRPQRFL